MEQNNKYKLKDTCYFIMIVILLILSFLTGVEIYNSKIGIIEVKPQKLLKYIDISLLNLDIKKGESLIEKTMNEYVNREKIYNFNVFLNDKEITTNVKLIDSSIKLKNVAKNKIAPGTYGKFSIIINNVTNSEDFDYEIKFENVTDEKPKNMIFYLDQNGEKYRTLQELSNVTKGEVQKGERKKLVVNWEWLYDNGNDMYDTNDGTKLKKYVFKIIVVGKGKENEEGNY